MFNIGDRVKTGYFFDGCKGNYQFGTITWVHEYNSYPNNDYSIIEKKIQGTVVCDNGYRLEIGDLYADFQGVKYIEKVS